MFQPFINDSGSLIHHWVERMHFPHEMKLLQKPDSNRHSGFWCYMLSFMVICHPFACLCDSFPGKCVSFLHMLHVITEDLLPKWINSLSSRWLMESCKFFYSPINRNTCFTSFGIKTLVQNIASKKVDHLTNLPHPEACVVLFIDTKTYSTLELILLFFSVSVLMKYLWRKLQRYCYQNKPLIFPGVWEI